MFRVAHGSANWITVPLGLALLMAGLATPLAWPWLFSLSFVPFFLFMAFWFFFRDPERRVAEGVASPADGKVTALGPFDDPDLGPAERLSIFMRVTDVHVNRFPLEGDVRGVVHRPGKHFPAFSKDSERNERVTLRMRTDLGDIKVVQIAGAVARRIVPYSQPGDHVGRGDRLGLIRLGSRCDLIVPAGSVDWKVRVGDRVFAASSRVAVAREQPRAGPSAGADPGGQEASAHPGPPGGDRAPGAPAADDRRQARAAADGGPRPGAQAAGPGTDASGRDPGEADHGLP